jgi:hypothetical protein
LGTTKLRVMTYDITKNVMHNIIPFIIMTLSIMTFNITDSIGTLSIMILCTSIESHYALASLCCNYTECHYDECHGAKFNGEYS